MRKRQAAPWRCLLFLFLFGMANEMRPKGRRRCRRPLGCHSGHLSAREQGPPFQRLAPCAGRQRAEHPVLNAAQQQGFEALRQGMAPSANQQAELHSLWEKAPGYVPAHRGGWGEVPAAPAAAGAAQDAGEAARRQAFLKWTQGEAMTAQEKAFVEDLWNTDPAKASEYWAAGEFLDTEVPTSSALDGGGFDGTMENGKEIEHYMARRKTLERNKEKGRNYELEQLTEFHMKAIDVEEQVTIITDDGTKLRLDAIGRTIKENKLILQEYKSSNRARLTSNQKKGFPQILEKGGTVVGKGKGIYSRGFRIPAGTQIEIIRPKN